MGSKAALQLDASGEAEQPRYFSRLQCPNCFSDALTANSESTAIICSKCATSYPLIAAGNSSIPFLFAQVKSALHGWSARLNGFLHKNNSALESLRTALEDKKMSKLTRKRVKLLLRAKEQYAAQINSRLQFFSENYCSPEISGNVQLAQNQGVDSYLNNIFRDWCWENGENEQLLQALADVLPTSFKAGEVLTMGAGASRLSFDFHQHCDAEYSVLLDINPLLLSVARQIIDGEPVSLYEFPVAPSSLENNAILQKCKLPDTCEQSQADQFDCILGDASNVPFADKTFDTILTPWLIDIIPMDLREFIPHVNRLLKTGGIWINTGSLAFFHKNESWNYSENELIDLLKKYGFEVECVQRKEIQYLCSPHSSHGRVEHVFSFSARKKFDSVVAKPHIYLPDWITDDTRAIPQLNELVAASSKHLLQAQVLSAIDGVRSIREIGGLLAKQYDMSEENASAAVRQILIDNFKDYIA